MTNQRLAAIQDCLLFGKWVNTGPDEDKWIQDHATRTEIKNEFGDGDIYIFATTGLLIVSREWVKITNLDRIDIIRPGKGPIPDPPSTFPIRINRKGTFRITRKFQLPQSGGWHEQ